MKKNETCTLVLEYSTGTLISLEITGVLILGDVSLNLKECEPIPADFDLPS